MAHGACDHLHSTFWRSPYLTTHAQPYLYGSLHSSCDTCYDYGAYSYMNDAFAGGLVLRDSVEASRQKNQRTNKIQEEGRKEGKKEKEKEQNERQEGLTENSREKLRTNRIEQRRSGQTYNNKQDGAE